MGSYILSLANYNIIATKCACKLWYQNESLKIRQAGLHQCYFNPFVPNCSAMHAGKTQLIYFRRNFRELLVLNNHSFFIARSGLISEEFGFIIYNRSITGSILKFPKTINTAAGQGRISYRIFCMQ